MQNLRRFCGFVSKIVGISTYFFSEGKVSAGVVIIIESFLYQNNVMTHIFIQEKTIYRSIRILLSVNAMCVIDCSYVSISSSRKRY
jgi:hypothetical protein